MKCSLCMEAKLEDRYICQTRHTFCIVAKWPLKEGHILVLPKRHVINFSELSKEESKELFDEVDKMENILRRIYKEDIVVHVNRGKHSSQRHIHIHLIPLKAGLRQLVAHLEHIPEKKGISANKMIQMQKKIKSRLV